MELQGTHSSMTETAVLLITCPDSKGLVAAVSGLLFAHGANILHADQHQDAAEGLFFMRVEWQLEAGPAAASTVPTTSAAPAASADESFNLPAFEAAFAPLARQFLMHWSLHTNRQQPRVAVFVSQHLHCLADLLHRHSQHELAGNIALVVSNHPDGADLSRFHGIPFHYIPLSRPNTRPGTPADPALRLAAEQRQMDLLAAQRIDLVVLARYMQVLSPAFIARFPSAIINVHHSFLPAFVGARPYHAAFARGVKLIGATSHYATAALDDGPIIEQDVARISHRDSIPDLIARGRDLERLVLFRAVRWHLDHRIVTYGNKTVVFD